MMRQWRRSLLSEQLPLLDVERERIFYDDVFEWFQLLRKRKCFRQPVETAIRVDYESGASTGDRFDRTNDSKDIVLCRRLDLYSREPKLQTDQHLSLGMSGVAPAHPPTRRDFRANRPAQQGMNREPEGFSQEIEQRNFKSELRRISRRIPLLEAMWDRRIDVAKHVIIRPVSGQNISPVNLSQPFPQDLSRAKPHGIRIYAPRALAVTNQSVVGKDLEYPFPFTVK
jgi:hypothetical protein